MPRPARISGLNFVPDLFFAAALYFRAVTVYRDMADDVPPVSYFIQAKLYSIP